MLIPLSPRVTSGETGSGAQPGVTLQDGQGPRLPTPAQGSVQLKAVPRTLKSLL